MLPQIKYMPQKKFTQHRNSGEIKPQPLKEHYTKKVTPQGKGKKSND